MADAAITRWLDEVRAGHAEALPRLVDGVLNELRAMAHAALRRERRSALQTTELVNEAWLRIAGERPLDFECRAHFFHAAATAMRRVLVDAARRRKAAKRGGGVVEAAESADELLALAAPLAEHDWEEIEALHKALERLEQEPSLAAKGRVVELRFFAGLTIEQVAEVLDRSAASVKRDWEFCRAWLAREIANGPDGLRQPPDP